MCSIHTGSTTYTAWALLCEALLAAGFLREAACAAAAIALFGIGSDRSWFAAGIEMFVLGVIAVGATAAAIVN